MSSIQIKAFACCRQRGSKAVIDSFAQHAKQALVSAFSNCIRDTIACAMIGTMFMQR